MKQAGFKPGVRNEEVRDFEGGESTEKHDLTWSEE